MSYEFSDESQSEPSAGQPRGGLFLPDVDKLSKQWLAKIDGLTAQLLQQSEEWQVKVDNLASLLETFLVELQAMQGFTISIDRRDDAVPES